MNPEDNIFEGDDYDIYNYNELLNSSFNNLRPNQLFPQSQLSAYEEDSGDMNPEDNIFEGDDYDIYNYNELLNSNYERQIPQLSYENVTNMVNSIINFEK